MVGGQFRCGLNPIPEPAEMVRGRFEIAVVVQQAIDSEFGVGPWCWETRVGAEDVKQISTRVVCSSANAFAFAWSPPIDLSTLFIDRLPTVRVKDVPPVSALVEVVSWQG